MVMWITFTRPEIIETLVRLSSLFGTRGAQAPSRRAAQREQARQRQEREMELKQWSARLRDRARGALALPAALEPQPGVD